MNEQGALFVSWCSERGFRIKKTDIIAGINKENTGKVHKYCIGLVQSSRGQIRTCKYE